MQYIINLVGSSDPCYDPPIYDAVTLPRSCIGSRFCLPCSLPLDSLQMILNYKWKLTTVIWKYCDCAFFHFLYWNLMWVLNYCQCECFIYMLFCGWHKIGRVKQEKLLNLVLHKTSSSFVATFLFLLNILFHFLRMSPQCLLYYELMLQ